MDAPWAKIPKRSHGDMGNIKGTYGKKMKKIGFKHL